MLPKSGNSIPAIIAFYCKKIKINNINKNNNDNTIGKTETNSKKRENQISRLWSYLLEPEFFLRISNCPRPNTIPTPMTR